MTRRDFIGASAAVALAPAQSPAFPWPKGKRCAVSLTFDDARFSQVDTGLDLLKQAGAKATFYLVPERAAQRLDAWKRAAAEGHEIANHSRTHPCTANYAFSRNKALEDYTLERLAADIDGAIGDIQRMIGVRTVSFAYPCGQKFVGRGREARSYIPVIAERFLTGRGYLDESPNDPMVCDLAALMGTGFDGVPFDTMRTIVEAARKEGRWVVFVGHDIGKSAHQTVDAEALRQLCAWAHDPASGVWLDTVANVAAYVQTTRGEAAQPIIDIHQHTNYLHRTDDALIEHQRAMGITTTVLLPAGSKYGLAADAGGNDTVVRVAKRLPREFVYFANELPDIPEADAVIRKYLKTGAIGIGEQKFKVNADSAHIDKIAGIAAEFGVPVLMHFEHGSYNLGIDRFHRVLEKYPKVNFIGHAQTWWGNIDKEHTQTEMYPKKRVVRGGITDCYLSDYPNMFGDLSAGSGLNALLRDEEHTREFLDRHQNKLMYGSDCPDADAKGEKCSGWKCLVAVRRLLPSRPALRKVLHDNAARVILKM